MDSSFFRSAGPIVTDVYTDLNGLQNLKAEKNNDEALKKVSQQFESMFINMLLKNMRSANDVFAKGNPLDSQESKFYRDMHDQQLALTISHGRGFGIADSMYRQLSRNYGSDTASKERQVRVDPQNLMPSQAVLKQRDASSLPVSHDIKNTNVNTGSAQNSDATVSAPDRARLADSPADFVSKVLEGAKKAAQELGVEKEILIAQAALETGWGAKVYAKNDGESTNNLFNIKADSRWNGDRVAKDTLEFIGGRFSKVASQFRSYDSIHDSFSDFSAFIRNGDRYQNALNGIEGGMDFIKEIHQSGYATDPHYVSKVESVLNRVKSLIDSGLATDKGASP